MASLSVERPPTATHKSQGAGTAKVPGTLQAGAAARERAAASGLWAAARASRSRVSLRAARASRRLRAAWAVPSILLLRRLGGIPGASRLVVDDVVDELDAADMGESADRVEEALSFGAVGALEDGDAAPDGRVEMVDGDARCRVEGLPHLSETRRLDRDQHAGIVSHPALWRLG